LEALTSASEILELRAIAYLDQKRSNEALADIELCLRLADLILPDPYLISHRAARLILLNAIQPVWEGLASRAWSEEQLRRLETVLLQYNLFESFSRAAKGEILLQLEGWNRMFSDPPPEMSQRERESHAILRVIYPRGWAYQNQGALWRFYGKEIAPLLDPKVLWIPPEALKDNAEFERLNFFFDPRAGMDLLSGALTELARAQTGVHLAGLALALERHYQSKGRYPETLSALVPDFRPQVPVDVVGGQPLQYRADPHRRFVLFSVGWDGQSNNGRLGHGWADWVWSYPDPKETASKAEP
jgi:hypothetical protein